jgi:hypothetical protein
VVSPEREVGEEESKETEEAEETRNKLAAKAPLQT